MVKNHLLLAERIFAEIGADSAQVFYHNPLYEIAKTPREIDLFPPEKTGRIMKVLIQKRYEKEGKIFCHDIQISPYDSDGSRGSIIIGESLSSEDRKKIKKAAKTFKYEINKKQQMV